MTDFVARNEKQLGAILRRVRKSAGLSQTEMGEIIHLRQGTVSKLEAGAPASQLQTLMAALAALNLELVVRSRHRVEAQDFEDIFG
jgi:HTH-type transcriptional regulator/antitoxin HipB